jgi:hypothetical protein
MENLKFKIGDFYYYQNQYMDDAWKLQLIDKSISSSGEIYSLKFKKPDNERLELLKNDVKYITKKEKGVDGYTFEKQFRSFVKENIGETPTQTFELVKSINQKKSKGIATITFTEEVKDGRTPRFNKSNPLRLKNKEFNYKGIVLKITDIEYIGENIQPSDYNEYIDSNYSMKYSIKYDDSLKYKRGGNLEEYWYKGLFN